MSHVSKFLVRVGLVGGGALMSAGCSRGAPVGATQAMPSSARACVPSALLARGEARWVVDGAGLALNLAPPIVDRAKESATTLHFDPHKGSFSAGERPTSGGQAATTPAGGNGLRIERFATSVRACRGDGADCATVAPAGFAGAGADYPSELRAHLPADASPDGTRLFVVRHDGKHGTHAVGETYDLATRRLLSAIDLDADQYVDRVAWIGTRVLVVTCLMAGPGCSARLVDPTSGVATLLGINVYAARHFYVHVRDDLWAFVDTRGDRVVFAHASDGRVDGAVALLDEATRGSDPERGVDVMPTETAPDGTVAGIAIAYSAPFIGQIVQVDLVGRRVVSRSRAQVCPGVDRAGTP